MQFTTLSQWLDWQDKLHFTKVDPGLERIGRVWQKMGGVPNLPYPLITIAGTNGKGSSVAMLAAILQAAGYQVGSYTSPHLLRYNERICINSVPCSDQQICDAFQQIEAARADISLTYFEFATLAAVTIFSQQHIDIAILEVGMGGRLDATNLFACDIALITPIDLDHTAWLGENREQIGREKAGILRQNKPLVCAETSPPSSVLSTAATVQAPCYIAGADFQFSASDNDWCWSSKQRSYNQLSLPALAGHYQLDNAAAVLQVVELVNERHHFSITEQYINQGLNSVKLAGRFQQIAGEIEQILDVTHNRQGADNLAKLLAETPCNGKTIAVLAMLQDKDPLALVQPLNNIIDTWYLAGLADSRGMAALSLLEAVKPVIGAAKLNHYEIVAEAYQQAMANANKGDRVLVFGSFYTVEAVMRLMPDIVN